MSPSLSAAAAEWDAAWSILGLPAPHGLAERVALAYAEPTRAYHDRQHLQECFAQFGAVRDQLACPAEVALALWFHDAVYDPQRPDNEAQSAAWAARELEGAGVAADPVARIVALILATRHAAPPPPGDAAFLVDIDLAILGAAGDRFDEYEAQIRREYAFVPAEAFRVGRSRILQGFLDRPVIYATAPFQAQLEARARANLARSLRRLTDAADPAT